MTAPRTLICATLGLVVLAVVLAVAFADTGDAHYLAAVAAALLAAYCAADPVRQQPAAEVQS